MACATGVRSVGELLMTLRISLVAVCCSSASDFALERFGLARHRLRQALLKVADPEPSLFRALRAIGGLASTLALAGLAPRRIGLSLPLTAVPTAQRSRAGYAKGPSWASRRAGSSMRRASAPDVGWVDPDFCGARRRLGKATGEAFGVDGVGGGEHGRSGRHALVGQAKVHVVGGEQAQTAVMVFDVVPREEDVAVGPGVLDRPDPHREVRAVLQRLELRFREGVVVGEWGGHGSSSRRGRQQDATNSTSSRPAIGVDSELPTVDALAGARLVTQYASAATDYPEVNPRSAGCRRGPTQSRRSLRRHVRDGSGAIPYSI